MPLTLVVAATPESPLRGAMPAFAFATTRIIADNLHVCILGSCETVANAPAACAFEKNRQAHPGGGRSRERDATRLQASSELTRSIWAVCLLRSRNPVTLVTLLRALVYLTKFRQLHPSTFSLLTRPECTFGK